jgi:hypothetical protein
MMHASSLDSEMDSDSSVELVDFESHLDMGGKDEAEQAHNTAFAWVKVLARPLKISTKFWIESMPTKMECC